MSESESGGKKMRGVRSLTNGSHSAKEADGKRMKGRSPSVRHPFSGRLGVCGEPTFKPTLCDVFRTTKATPC